MGLRDAILAFFRRGENKKEALSEAKDAVHAASLNKKGWLALFAACALTVPVDARAQTAAVPQTSSQITLSFAPVVKNVAPAVVNIYTRSRVRVQENLSPFMNDPLFRQFFGNQGFGGRTREQVVSSLGSGVIIKQDGVIVTSYHVVKDAQEITVALADRREMEAKVVVRDPQSDLAFLKVESAAPLPFLEIRDSDTLEVGDLVLAIGNPFGVGQTVTSGIISALARKAQGVSDYQFFIQTDAAINPGNSGGALVDMNGRLIGINTAIYSTSGGSSGIGFAIPANMVRSVLEGKVQGGRVVRPWLGLTVQPVTSEIAESLGMTLPQGVLITKVVPGSPAQQAGLRQGDVVTMAGGIAVAGAEDMHYRMALGRIGDKVGLQIVRDGKTHTLSVLLAAPPEMPKRDVRTLNGRHPLQGATVANLSPALAVELGLDDLEAEGVVILSSGTTMGAMTLAAGDIVREVNGEAIATTAQLEKRMNSGARNWQIVYQRGANLITLSIRM